MPRVYAYNPVFPSDHQIVKVLEFKPLFRNICCSSFLRKPSSFHCTPSKKLRETLLFVFSFLMTPPPFWGNIQLHVTEGALQFYSVYSFNKLSSTFWCLSLQSLFVISVSISAFGRIGRQSYDIMYMEGHVPDLLVEILISHQLRVINEGAWFGKIIWKKGWLILNRDTGAI